MIALISGITLAKFAYFMFWAFLGQFAMVVVQQKRYVERIQSQTGFSIKIWLKDNGARVLISFIVALCLSPIAVITIMNAPGGPSELAAIGAGAIIDKTVEAYTNPKK